MERWGRLNLLKGSRESGAWSCCQSGNLTAEEVGRRVFSSIGLDVTQRKWQDRVQDGCGVHGGGSGHREEM